MIFEGSDIVSTADDGYLYVQLPGFHTLYPFTPDVDGLMAEIAVENLQWFAGAHVNCTARPTSTGNYHGDKRFSGENIQVTRMDPEGLYPEFRVFGLEYTPTCRQTRLLSYSSAR